MLGQRETRMCTIQLVVVENEVLQYKKYRACVCTRRICEITYIGNTKHKKEQKAKLFKMSESKKKKTSTKGHYQSSTY